MSDKTLRAVLFYTLLVVFCVTAILELASLAGWQIIHIDPDYKLKLFTLLIAEVIASIFAFWKQLSGNQFGDPPQVEGAWEYECIKDDETYKHGGSCKIALKRASLGWEFTIQGKRTWMANKINGEWQRENLAAASSWENTWGTFTGNDALRYAYSINTKGNLVQGYGWATIAKDSEGRPNLMEGNFFQLPPHDPFYGFQRYWR
jgi:hypothetical protein